MRFSRLVSAGMTLAGAFMLPGAALAQYSPDATGDLGAAMGSTALGQSVLSGTREIGRDGTDSDELSPTMKRYCAEWPNEGVCRADRARQAQRKQASAKPSEERMRQLMAQVQGEYEERVHRDGRPAADKWLSETAYELGRQEGKAERGGQR